jgi:lipopolysaccharide transport system ATP-binding protein
VRIDLFDDRGIRVILVRSDFTGHAVTLRAGRGSVHCAIQDLPLANGLYTVSIYIAARADTEVLDWIEDAASVTISGGDFFGTGNLGLPRTCKVFVRASWSCV